MSASDEKELANKHKNILFWLFYDVCLLIMNNIVEYNSLENQTQAICLFLKVFNFKQKNKKGETNSQFWVESLYFYVQTTTTNFWYSLYFF